MRCTHRAHGTRCHATGAQVDPTTRRCDEHPPTTVRVPHAFLFDHEARDLPTPEVVRETKSHVWVRRDAPELPELVSDARYYADPTGFDPYVQRTLCRSARALLAALERAGALDS